MNEWESKSQIYKRQKQTDEVFKILDMSSQDRFKLTPEECVNASIILNDYCVYLNKLAQEEYANHIWAEEQISRSIAKNSNNYNCFLFEEKKIKVRANEALELSKISLEAQLKSTRLRDYSKGINEIAKNLINLSQTKRK